VITGVAVKCLECDEWVHMELLSCPTSIFRGLNEMVYILIVVSHIDNESEQRPIIDFFADGTVSALDLAKLALEKQGLSLELTEQKGRPPLDEALYWYGYDPQAEVEAYFMKLTETQVTLIQELVCLVFSG